MAAPGLMHQLTCRLAGCARSEGGVLWRWEPPKNGQPLALVQSSVDMHVQKPPKYVAVEGPRCLAQHLGRLADGDVIRYMVAISPVRRSDGSDRYVRRDEWDDWWTAKAATRGMQVASAVYEMQPNRRHPKSQLAGLRCLVIHGYGAVADSDLLRQSILAGIGRGKAYGCGLMTVAHT